MATESVRSCSTSIKAPSSTRATRAPVAVGAVGSPSDLTGIQTVVRHYISGISAMSDDDTTSWHGRTVRLTAVVHAVSTLDEIRSSFQEKLLVEA